MHINLIKNFILLIVVNIHINVTLASSLDDAVHAMRAGDFAEAYCIMRPLADYGDSDAQYNIGWMYLNGYGLRVNDSLALEWWVKASEQGHADASFSIGMLYSLGEGDVPKDSNAAIDYYLLAAEEGQEDAVTIVKSMMQRNDPVIRKRLHEIIKEYSTMFGTVRKVKVKRLNARKGASVEQVIVTKLLKDQQVLEIDVKGKWSQVVILNNEKISRAVWVFNPLLEQ